MDKSTNSEALLATLLNSVEDAVVGTDSEGTIRAWNRGATQIYGYSEEEAVGRSMRCLLPLYEAPDWEKMLESTEIPSEWEKAERIVKGGARIAVLVRRAIFRDGSGPASGILEMSRLGGASHGETPTEMQLRHITEQMPMVMWTTDRNFKITSTWGSRLKRGRAGVSQAIWDYFECDSPDAAPLPQHYKALEGAPVQFEYQHKERVFDMQVDALRAASGEIIGCIGLGIDVTDRKRSADEVRFQATHDSLTGLANYRAFSEALEQEMRRADRSHRTFSVLLMDMDGLKRINDRFGHLAGNRALRRLAEVLKQQCRSTDLAARYGGDEFAVILIDSDAGMAAQVIRRIESGLEAELEEPRVSVSIGVATFPEDGRTAGEILEAADQRMYRGKDLGRAQRHEAAVGAREKK